MATRVWASGPDPAGGGASGNGAPVPPPGAAPRATRGRGARDARDGRSLFVGGTTIRPSRPRRHARRRDAPSPRARARGRRRGERGERGRDERGRAERGGRRRGRRVRGSAGGRGERRSTRGGGRFFAPARERRVAPRPTRGARPRTATEGAREDAIPPRAMPGSPSTRRAREATREATRAEPSGARETRTARRVSADVGVDRRRDVVRAGNRSNRLVVDKRGLFSLDQNTVVRALERSAFASVDFLRRRRYDNMT